MLNIGFKQVKGYWYLYAEGRVSGEKVTRPCGSIFRPDAWVECFKICCESGTPIRRFFTQVFHFLRFKLTDEEVSTILPLFLQGIVLNSYPAIKDLAARTIEPELELLKRVKPLYQRIILFQFLQLLLLESRKGPFKEFDEVAKRFVETFKRKVERKIGNKGEGDPIFWEVVFQQDSFPPQILKITDPYPSPIFAPRPSCGVCGGSLISEEIYDAISINVFFSTLSITRLSIIGEAFCNKCNKTYGFRAEVVVKEPLLLLFSVPKEDQLVKESSRDQGVG